MALELLKALIATRSLSGHEADAARLLASWLGDHRVAATIDDEHNVIVEVTGEAPGPTLLLNSHLDTVPAGEGWESDPWSPYVHEGRLVGLGSGDAKASVATMASAALAIAKAGLPCGKLIFAATVKEEVGHGGLETLKPRLGPIDAALVGEPTSLHAALAQGGLLILEATARGVSSHAARAHLGKNALTAAARDLIALDALELDRVHPLLGPSSANVTVIQGGKRHNVIPDTCGYTLDIRYTPSYTWEELVALIDAATEADIRVRSSRLQPVETSAESPIARAIAHAHPEASFFGSPTMSDWVHLKGIDAIKIGPGDSERSHTANESVSLAHVEAAVELYAGAAQHFFASAS